MTLYQLRYLNEDNEVLLCRGFEAPDDEGAIVYGDKARRLTAMQLWDGDRLVREWDAFPPL